MAQGDVNFPSLSSTGPSSLGQESHLSLGEQDPTFVNPADHSRFTCPVHNGILRHTCQTECGHRICQQCVGIYLNGAESKRCPVGESDCVDITASNVYPDRSIQREMKNVLVYCKNKIGGCPHQIKFRDLGTHLDECEYQTVSCGYSSRGCREELQRRKQNEHKKKCPFRPVQCEWCHAEVSQNQMQKHQDEICPEKVTGCPYGCGNKELKRKQVDDHKAVCPVRPVDCKFKPMGCTFAASKETVEKHEKEDLRTHLELVTQYVAELQLAGMDTQTRLQTIMQERETLQQSLEAAQSMGAGPQGHLRQMESTVKELRLKLVSLMEKVIILERKIPELVVRPQLSALEQNVTGIQQRLTQLEQRRETDQQQQRSAGDSGPGVAGAATRVGRYGTVENMADAFSTQLTAHDRQLGVHDVRMAEMDLRFQLLETASYDGTLVWKIRDYDRRKRDAMNGRTLSLYSQPFYTGRFGYKMCARVYLNGDGMGKTTHMSLFFVVMRGEYDALLVWPFRQKVNLTLLDQSAEKRHLTDHFQPDPNSSSFQRPTSEMNVASGCPLFVSHSVLENQTNGYLRDDTIFIRIVVDQNPNPALY